MLDSKLVISGYAQTYISKDALYLYEEDYDGAMITNIAKFALDEGRISGVAAAAVEVMSEIPLQSMPVMDISGY